MAAELIAEYSKYTVWQTKKGYFVKDKNDNTPIFYNKEYSEIRGYLLQLSNLSSIDFLKIRDNK